MGPTRWPMVEDAGQYRTRRTIHHGMRHHHHVVWLLRRIEVLTASKVPTVPRKRSAFRLKSIVARAGVVAGLVAGCVALPAVGGVPVAHAAVAGSSSYVPVGPVRLVDTRENKGFTRSAPTTLQVPVAGINGVPKTAVADRKSVV